MQQASDFVHAAQVAPGPLPPLPVAPPAPVVVVVPLEPAAPVPVAVDPPWQSGMLWMHWRYGSQSAMARHSFAFVVIAAWFVQFCFAGSLHEALHCAAIDAPASPKQAPALSHAWLHKAVVPAGPFPELLLLHACRPMAAAPIAMRTPPKTEMSWFDMLASRLKFNRETYQFGTRGSSA